MHVTGPAILGGDFNAPVHAQALEPLRERWPDAFTRAGFPPEHAARYSFPHGPQRDRAIDHIFVSTDIRVEGCSVHVDETGASDHNPVVAEFEVTGC
jgi:endonuclease/exonuclease/phosphatase (EEP) superfamily protein YafD